jgi:hypothetical protein
MPAPGGRINQVLNYPQRFDGDSNDVIKRFSSQRIASEYEQLYQELLKGRHVI